LLHLSITIYALAVIAVVVGALEAIVLPYRNGWRLLVGFEAFVLLVLLLMQAYQVRVRCRNRWIAFRAMAEYFRIGGYLVFTAPPNTNLEFDRLARLYSWSSRPGRTPWFGPVIEEVWYERPKVTLDDADVSWLAPYLWKSWIEPQAEYHESQHKMHARWTEIFRWAIVAVLGLTLCLVLTHFAYAYADSVGRHEPRNLIEPLLAFFAISMTSVAAALNGYAGQQQHHRHAERFKTMSKELERTSTSILGVGTMSELKSELHEVTRAMLGEATDWYQGMQSQLMDMPT
jgi:hypothetical protein